MKIKNLKHLTLLILVVALILILPNFSKAATETYNDTEQGIVWSYEVDSNNQIINLTCTTTSKTGAVTIPSTIDEKTVVSLGGKYSYSDGAFENCAGITSVTIPNTITTIGCNAFENCTGLKSIEIPDSVTTIGEDAFLRMYIFRIY